MCSGEGPAPPNITISSHKLELGFNSSSSQSTSNIISSMDTPLFNLQVIPDGIGNGRNLISTLGEHSLLSELVKNISNIGDQHIVSRVWEIQNFSTIFKTIRVTAGFGLADVVDAISLIFGPEIDEITLRFESLNIPLGRGLKIKPMLEKWVESIKSKRSSFMKKISSKTSSSDSEPDQKRFFGRKRTKIEARNREYMETVFIQCPKPTYEQLITISTNTSLDRDVVRVWFSNRRQKEKRKKDNRGTASEVSFVRREYDLKASIHPSPSCLLVHRPGAGSTFQPDRDFNLTPVQDLDQLSQEGRADLGLNGRNSFKMKPEPVFQPENTALDFDTRYFSTLESKPKQEMHPSSPNQQTQSLNYPGVNLTFPTHNMTSSSNTLSSSKEVRPGYAQNDDLGRMEEFDSEDSSLSLVDEEGEAGRKVPERASIKEETEFSVSQDTRQSTGSPSDPGKKSVIVENSFVRSNTGRTYTEDLLDNPLLMTPKVDDEQNRSEEDWEQFF
ncbi:POU domain, class 2, transcription factor 1 isoform X3 [Eurytemora carolleeae]|uniref:POU domain, class 2, transcription factor 1 isoform X3 n=1 Tax=Eurytemora carolleeae TaxID=1294199 RepID=UPI000C75AAA7|nr:POU domain, class 2, transcription factor 1 isoform X3 [Eurytemora carolleeae]|eukprot:XP_023341063.1 POU domain, class 2, transcription factor 1-like isoform X3 [Eurytemora affinis]